MKKNKFYNTGRKRSTLVIKKLAERKQNLQGKDKYFSSEELKSSCISRNDKIEISDYKNTMVTQGWIREKKIKGKEMFCFTEIFYKKFTDNYNLFNFTIIELYEQRRGREYELKSYFANLLRKIYPKYLNKFLIDKIGKCRKFGKIFTRNLPFKEQWESF